MGLPVKQLFDPEHFDDIIEFWRVGALFLSAPGTVFQIAPHIHVRKKPRVLEDITDLPILRRNLQPARAVEKRLAVQDNFPGVGGH